MNNPTVNECPTCEGNGHAGCGRMNPHYTCEVYQSRTRLSSNDPPCPPDCPDWRVCPTCSGTGRVVVPPDMTREAALAALWPDFTEDPDRDIDIAAVEQACKTWPAAVLVLVYEEAKRRMGEEKHG